MKYTERFLICIPNGVADRNAHLLAVVVYLQPIEFAGLGVDGKIVGGVGVDGAAGDKALIVVKINAERMPLGDMVGVEIAHAEA